MISSPLRSKSEGGPNAEDRTLIDLMGAIFDGFLSSPEAGGSTAICCDGDSRQLGFDVIASAARSCNSGDGYLALVTRINAIIRTTAPSLRHLWGHDAFSDEAGTHSMTSTSKYSGLRNQGCTCYMNSVLQQLFMMPGLRKNLCSSTVPSSLRTSGGGNRMKGVELIGKNISLQWDSGVSYPALVEGYNKETGAHTIRYLPLQIATARSHMDSLQGSGQQQSQQIYRDDVASFPQELQDEFFLSEGRPGRETGVFEIIPSDGLDVSGGEIVGESSNKVRQSDSDQTSRLKETEEEASSRHLLEEVQRTFVHLDEGVRGRCFDPRSLVEASGCLKLEFDVWQQNDASEFAMKLLDRLEGSLKRWAPENFKYLDHTFGLKQTKQKICEECGLKVR
jgi:ubiquitin carboxyl-terminal hydrolase 9/24